MQERMDRNTHTHTSVSSRAQRGNDAPGASQQQVPRLDGCRSSAAYTGELIAGDDFAPWVLHSPSLFAIPSKKLGRSNFFLSLSKKKISSFCIQ